MTGEGSGCGAGGVHIAFEGIDGSGLTTHSKRLVEELKAAGCKAEYSKEPTRGPVGELIRSLLKGEKSSRHDLLALLFAADRIWNYYDSPTSIARLKSEGYIVVSDRYKYSSIAYQGAHTDIDWVWTLNSRVPHADIVVFLDVPVEVSARRIESRVLAGGVREQYERAEVLERIKASYGVVLERAEMEGVRVVRVRGVEGGVERSIEEVAWEVKREVFKLLRLQP